MSSSAPPPPGNGGSRDARPNQLGGATGDRGSTGEGGDGGACTGTGEGGAEVLHGHQRRAALGSESQTIAALYAEADAESGDAQEAKQRLRDLLQRAFGYEYLANWVR